MTRPGGYRPAWALLTGTLSIVFVLLGSPRAAAQGSLEYAIKATYIYKFGPFIEWPAATFPSPSSPLTLCVVGADPFGALLDDAVHDQQINGHPIILRRIDQVTRSSGCQIAFIGGSAAQTVSQALAELKGAPTLTITDEARTAQARGMINFVIRDNRVRFEIDGRAAQESGISVSSKLQSLAVPVTPDRD